MYSCYWCSKHVEYKEDGTSAECRDCIVFRGYLTEKQFEEKICAIAMNLMVPKIKSVLTSLNEGRLEEIRNKVTKKTKVL